MVEPQAYFNGDWMPASLMAVSVTDAGFVLGATVTEQLRTFSRRIFRLEDHLDRLEHSLHIDRHRFGHDKAAMDRHRP